MCVCVYTHHMIVGAFGGQKKVSNLLELELWWL